MRLMRTRALAFSALTVLTLTTNRLSYAVPTHALGDASTSGFLQGAGTGATARGWEFQVNAANVQIVQLGVNARTDGTPLTLSLWDDNSQNLLAQTSVISSAGNWVFANLDSPVSLISGGLYSVIGWGNTDFNAWYQYNNDPPAVFMPTGVIEFTATRFDRDVGPDIFPSATIPVGSYGVTDIGYEIVPEPSAFILTALCGPVLLTWQKKMPIAAALGVRRRAVTAVV